MLKIIPNVQLNAVREITMPLRGGSYLPDISCLRKETGVVSFILSP